MTDLLHRIGYTYKKPKLVPGKADKARYLNIAQGSLEESRYYLILAHDLGYGNFKEV